MHPRRGDIDVDLLLDTTDAMEIVAARRWHDPPRPEWLRLDWSMARVLWAVDPELEPNSAELVLGTLARQLGWHPSTLTPRLIALEERNLIIRASLGPDGRIRTVQLTPLGRAIRSRTRAQAATGTGLSALEPRELERIARMARIAT